MGHMWIRLRKHGHAVRGRCMEESENIFSAGARGKTKSNELKL